MATIVLCHGAWSGGWSWRKLRGPLAEAGHQFWSPSYSGVGDRAHLLSPDITLETHIADIAGLIRVEELSEVILLGHSYGGMVATGVADRARKAVAEVIYLDAFVPEDGQALFDYVPPAHRTAMEAKAAAEGDGWRVPPNPVSDDTPPEDRPWIERHRGDMPIACFSQKLSLGAPVSVPRHFIHATVKPEGDVFRQFAERYRDAPDWTFREIAASHAPNIVAPEALMECLNEILGG